MSADTNNDKSKEGKEQTPPAKKADIVIELNRDKEMERMQKEQKEAEDAARIAKEELEKERQEKAKLALDVESAKQVAADYEQKLALIAKKEFDAKHAIVAKRIQDSPAFQGDEARKTQLLKDIENPEKIKDVEYMVNVLDEGIQRANQVTMEKLKHEQEEAARIAEENRKRAEQDAKKSNAGTPPPAPKGGDTANLAGNLTPENPTGQKFYEGATEDEANKAMVDDLYKLSKSKNPAVAAEAEAQLRQMWGKYIGELKTDYTSKKMKEGVEVDMTLKNVKAHTGVNKGEAIKNPDGSPAQ